MEGVSFGWKKKPIAQAYQNAVLPEFWYVQDFWRERRGGRSVLNGGA